MKQERKRIAALIILLAAFSIMALAVPQNAAAATKEVNLSTVPNTLSVRNAQFVVRSIKYDPYPVEPGNWFDLYLKIENIGQNDAKDAVVQFAPTYPFMQAQQVTSDLGRISGKISAAANKQNEATTTLQDNQAVIRFRIYVDPSAGDGEYNVNFKIATDGNLSEASTYSVPVQISKTKTQFQLSEKYATPERSVFVIQNTGDKIAGGVSLQLIAGQDALTKGSTIESLGTLNPGDFVSATYYLSGNYTPAQVKFNLSYTDTAGNRVSELKAVPFTMQQYQSSSPKQGLLSGKYSSWAFLATGLVVGIIFSIAILFARRKK